MFIKRHTNGFLRCLTTDPQTLNTKNMDIQRQVNSGSLLRLVLCGGSAQPTYFPGKRCQYLVGLKAFVLKNIHEKGFHHLVLSPSITTPTYNVNGRCLMSVKSFPVLQDEELAVDLSAKMEYYVIDMTASDTIELRVLTNEAKEANDFF